MRKISLLFILFYCSSVNIPAQDTLSTGYLKFNLNVDSAYVVVNNNYFEWQKVASGDSIKLLAMRNYITLSTPFDSPLRTGVYIPEDTTFTLSYNFSSENVSNANIQENLAARFHFDANVMVLSDEDSEIYYKGDYKGTGFAKFNAPEELAYLEIKNPDFGTTRKRLNIRERRINFVEDYTRPSRAGAYSVAVIPGASQFYKRQNLKGTLISVTSATLFTFTLHKYSQYRKEFQNFLDYKVNYLKAQTEAAALKWGDLAEEQKVKVQRLDNQRRFLMLSSILLYGFNIYDALSNQPKGGYQKKEKDLKFYLSQEEVLGSLGTTGTFKYHF
ncbi:MAG: DUF5683 domain-containing protein [Balneolaceae bacterium]